MADVDEIIVALNERSGVSFRDEEQEEPHAGARVVTLEELKRIEAAERAFAEAAGRR